MPAASSVSLVGESLASHETGVRRVIAEAEAADGASPLDEAAELALRHDPDGTSMWVAGDPDGLHGFAWLHDGALDVPSGSCRSASSASGGRSPMRRRPRRTPRSPRGPTATTPP